jgi:hypothetical protein
VLDEHARQAGSACDERTIDARRSDALVDLVLDPTGMTSEVTNATREDSTDESNAVARDLAAGGTWRRILTDPASGRRRHHQVNPPLTDPEPLTTPDIGSRRPTALLSDHGAVTLSRGVAATVRARNPVFHRRDCNSEEMHDMNWLQALVAVGEDFSCCGLRYSRRCGSAGATAPIRPR